MNKRNRNIIIFFVFLILISSIICESGFRFLYQDDIVIKGKVLGDFEFDGDAEFPLNKHFALRGTNWSINFIGLERVSYWRGTTLKGEINTSQLKIIPVDNKDLNIFTLFDNENKVQNDNGTLNIYKIRNSFQGSKLELELYTKEANFNAIALNNCTFNIFNVKLITDEGDIEVIDKHHFVKVHSNDTIVMTMDALTGSYFKYRAGSINLPNPLILNGKIKITEFNGLVISKGKIYSSMSFEIDAEKIEVFTDVSPRMDPTHPKDWEIRVIYQNGGIIGIGVPYWSIGSLIGILIFPIFLIRLKGKKNLLRKENVPPKEK